MERTDIPFNIRLLNVTPGKLQGLRPVTSLDIFDGQTQNLHPDGLFSTLIFGRVGDERRSERYSFIDIKVSILHPVIFRALAKLKRLYADIISGKEYAIWSPETNDFVRANPTTGKTGFQFFLQYWKNIEFTDTKSVQREQNIMLLKKFEPVALTDKIIVMPAGLRDVEIDNGRQQMDEINGFYRNMLSVANVLSDAAVRHNPEVLNQSRWRLQVIFNDLYDYIENLVKGKKKLLLSGWASRNIMNGTRNVITAADTTVAVLGAPGNADFNTTVMGLYQACKAALPISVYKLKTGFLSKVFSSVGSPTKLVNKRTLEAEEVLLKPQYFDRFMTDEGLEKVLTSFGVEDVRHKTLEIEGRYVGLIYKGPDKTFRLMQDIRELPANRDPKDVSPLTFCELLYISVFMDVNGLPALITRYPVTGVGSIYPSKTLIQPTVKVEQRTMLDEHWNLLGPAFVAYRFPVRGSAFVNSTVPHSSKLEGLTADFDGDTVSANITYSDESKKEVHDFFKRKRAYVGTNGKFIASFDISTIALVFRNMTSNVVE